MGWGNDDNSTTNGIMGWIAAGGNLEGVHAESFGRSTGPGSGSSASKNDSVSGNEDDKKSEVKKKDELKTTKNGKTTDKNGKPVSNAPNSNLPTPGPSNQQEDTPAMPDTTAPEPGAESLRAGINPESYLKEFVDKCIRYTEGADLSHSVQMNRNFASFLIKNR